MFKIYPLKKDNISLNSMEYLYWMFAENDIKSNTAVTCFILLGLNLFFFSVLYHFPSHKQKPTHPVFLKREIVIMAHKDVW